MKKFSKLVFISTLLNSDKSAEYSDLPRWLKGLINNLEHDSYYLGSVMYRYTWKNKYYIQLEVPSNSCIFCQVMSYKGEFLKWPENLFQQFVDERTNETIVWENKLETLA